MSDRTSVTRSLSVWGVRIETMRLKRTGTSAGSMSELFAHHPRIGVTFIMRRSTSRYAGPCQMS